MAKTDHKPLCGQLKLQGNSRITRWMLFLNEFDFEIVHKKGSENQSADFFSFLKVHLKM